MNDDKWYDVVDKIKDRFEIIEREKMDLDDGGLEEAIVFDSPLGKMKVVRTSRPRGVHKGQSVGRHDFVEVTSTPVGEGANMMHQVEIFKWDNYADDWTKASLEL